MIPDGAKFIFISVPILLVSIFLILYFLGNRDLSKKNIFTDEQQEDVMNGQNPNDYDEFSYEIVTEGDGPSAGVGDTVTVNYEGTFKDGDVFDSSYERGTPFSFTLGEGGVIEGWEEGIKGMKIGEKRILYIPSDMGYGSEDYASIPGGSGLKFTVELLSID